MPLMPTRIGLVPLACLLGVIVILAVADLTWTTSPYYGRADAQPRTNNLRSVDVGTVPGEPASTTTSITTSTTATSEGLTVAHLVPLRIVIPTLSARAPVVAVGTTADGELDIPPDPRTVGWWSPGAKPGALTGTAVLAGHVNFDGVTGTLAAIGTLRPGDAIEVYGTHRGRPAEIGYTVTGVRTYHKTNLPYRQIFDRSGAGRLALVTCGGPFDASTGSYLDNIVTYAVPS